MSYRVNENEILVSDGSEDYILVHDEFDKSQARTFMLAHLTDNPEFPTPIGVFHQINKETYNDGVDEQIRKVTEKKGKGDLEKVLFGGNTWEVN